jgi:hypothetical protein
VQTACFPSPCTPPFLESVPVLWIGLERKVVKAILHRHHRASDSAPGVQDHTSYTATGLDSAENLPRGETQNGEG